MSFNVHIGSLVGKVSQGTVVGSMLFNPYGSPSLYVGARVAIMRRLRSAATCGLLACRLKLGRFGQWWRLGVGMVAYTDGHSGSFARCWLQATRNHDMFSAGPPLALRWSGSFPVADCPNNSTIQRNGPPRPLAAGLVSPADAHRPKSVACSARPCCLPHGRWRLLAGHLSLARSIVVRPSAPIMATAHHEINATTTA
jgi:hypothetical protein